MLNLIKTVERPISGGLPDFEEFEHIDGGKDFTKIPYSN